MALVSDRINSFILEFKEELLRFDINQFKRGCSYLKESFSDAIVTTLINPRMYVDYMTKTIDDLLSVTSNSGDLESFYTSVYKSTQLSDKGITISVQDRDEVDKLRPEYLDNFMAEFDNMLKNVIDGKANINDIRKKYVSGDCLEKTKKQIAKTSITMVDVKDLMIADNPTNVRVDNHYIQYNIIPFLKEHPQRVKELNALFVNTKGRIANTYGQLVATINSIEAIKSKCDVSKQKLIDYLVFNFARQYMCLCAYIACLFIRKTSYYSFNLMQFTALQNTLYDYFPEGELVLHESVLDGDLTDIDDTTLLNSMINGNLRVLTPHIQNCINKKKMEISNYMGKAFNYKLDYSRSIDADKYPYDVAPYGNLNKTIIDIAKDIHVFELSLKNEDLIIDDALHVAGLDETFLSKYLNVLSEVPSMNYYEYQKNALGDEHGSVMMSLYNDIDNFESNMERISSNVKRCYAYIEAMITSINENKFELDTNTNNELLSVMESIMTNYKEYILQVAKRLIERIGNLTESLDEIKVTDDTIDTEIKFYDYNFESYLEAYAEIERYEQEVYESYLREYNSARSLKDRGVKLVYEDVTTAPEGASTGATKAVSSTNQNSTSNSNGEASRKGNENASINGFRQWFENIKKKFTEMVHRLTKRNNPWIASIKSKLLNVDMDNVQITLAPYDEVTEEKLITEINGAVTKIKSINASSIPQELKGGKEKASLFLFSRIPQSVGDETTFGGKIRRFLTFGKTEKENLTTYSGDDARNKVNEMLAYCENYEKLHKSITTALNNLGDAAASKQQEILTGTGFNESVLFEAQQNEVKVNNKQIGNTQDTKNKVNSSSIITSVVREYTAGILTVVEKKYTDYIKVLNKLVPSDTKGESDNEEKSTNEPNNDATSNEK